MASERATGLLLVLLVCTFGGGDNAVVECPPEDDEVVCLEPFSFIRHPDCRFYYRCSNYIPTCLDCNDEQYFNPLTDRCDIPENVPDCVEGTYQPPTTTTEMTTPSATTTPTTPTTATTTTTTTEAPTMTTTTTPEPEPTTVFPFICPPEGVHTFPYPGNCSRYIRCFNAVPIEGDCSPLLFDKVDLVCKLEEDVVCDEEGPYRCPAIGRKVYPHNETCSKYFECFNGDLMEVRCATNTYFDEAPELLRCNLAEQAQCHSECREQGIHHVPIHARPCTWYKVCIDGHSANIPCPEGHVFDPDLSRCVSVEDYSCPYV